MNNLKNFIFPIIVSFTLISCKNKAKPFPQHFTTVEEIGEYFISTPGNVGLSIGIISDTLIQTYHFGKVAANDTLTPTDSSFYEIGSITKTFTAFLLALLEDDVAIGPRLNNQSIFEFSQNEKLKNKELITLATHTSGLTRVPTNLLPSNPLKLVSASRNPYLDYNNEDLKVYLKDCKLQKEGKFQYSNTGAALLGLILEDAAQQNYYSLLKERFLTKIGMSRTFYPLDEASQKQLVKPHTNRGAITEHWEFASLGAAGALRSNTLEMLEFLKFWTNENGDSTLEKARKKALSVQYSDEDIALAYGWMYSNLNKDSEQKIYWHNGGTGGFRTFTGFVEGQKKGVIIMSNTSNQVDDAGMAILRIL